MRPSKPWGWRSSGHLPVFGVRPRSESTRHECFVVDASLSVKTAGTAEMDEEEARDQPTTTLLLPRDPEAADAQSARRSRWGHCAPLFGTPLSSRADLGTSPYLCPKAPYIGVHRRLYCRRSVPATINNSLLRTTILIDRDSHTAQFASRRSPVRSRLAPLETPANRRFGDGGARRDQVGTKQNRLRPGPDDSNSRLPSGLRRPVTVVKLDGSLRGWEHGCQRAGRRHEHEIGSRSN